jgi:hypothetical protein
MSNACEPHVTGKSKGSASGSIIVLDHVGSASGDTQADWCARCCKEELTLTCYPENTLTVSTGMFMIFDSLLKGLSQMAKALLVIILSQCYMLMRARRAAAALKTTQSSSAPSSEREDCEAMRRCSRSSRSFFTTAAGRLL